MMAPKPEKNIENSVLIFFSQIPKFPYIDTFVTLDAQLMRHVSEYTSTKRHLAIFCTKYYPAKDKTMESVYRIGCWCEISEIVRSSMKTKYGIRNNQSSIDEMEMYMRLRGVQRCELMDLVDMGSYMTGNVRLLDDIEVMISKDVEKKIEGLMLEIFRYIQKYLLGLNIVDKDVVYKLMMMISDPKILPYYVGALISNKCGIDDLQKILDCDNIRDRLEWTLSLLDDMTDKNDIWKNNKTKIIIGNISDEKKVISKNRNSFDVSTLKNLNKGRNYEKNNWPINNNNDNNKDDDELDDLKRLERKLGNINMSKEAVRESKKELKRLRNLPIHSAEANIIRTYLETLSNLPWESYTEDTIDINRAKTQLNHDHYGLDHIKERILQYLAVRKLSKNTKNPILCLVGPPGVGKTSIGKSIATAMGRKYKRISLGGIRDDAELRGHRRTYVGAMPGTLIQGLITLGVKNPVFILDEVDKLAYNNPIYNPSAALLEILDPEQNSTFKDLYLGIPFDLSQIIFVCTCNSLETMPAALRDRLEVITLTGYTHYEKRGICTSHLIPKQLESHGLKYDENTSRLHISQETVESAIEKYTAESGVRELERVISAMCRWAALKIEEFQSSVDAVPPAYLKKIGDIWTIEISPSELNEILGNEKFDRRISERLKTPGIALGLSTSNAGGDVIFIETTKMKGKGKLILTGKLGDTMQESVRTAVSLLKAIHATQISQKSSLIKYGGLKKLGDSNHTPKGYPITSFWLDFNSAELDDIDLHVHFPSGSIPKDGPSAGIATTIAIAALFMNKVVNDDIAFTGEITLRGTILPVGGIKEKVLAAHRNGIARVSIPKQNSVDLTHIPSEILGEISIFCISNVHDALHLAFTHPLPSHLKAHPLSKPYTPKEPQSNLVSNGPTSSKPYKLGDTHLIMSSL